MTTLDRMFFANYVRNFAIVLVCLLSLYVVVDLFMNLNDFTKSNSGVVEKLVYIGGYYAAQIAVIFDRLAELVTLAAAVFTAAWMQRNNELLPQLSAGVPTRRVVRPILLGVLLTTSLAPLNTEFYIPAVADQLNASRNDSEQSKPTTVKGAFDSNGDLIEGAAAIRPLTRSVDPNTPDARFGQIAGFEYTSSAERGVELTHLTAERAVYVPPNAAGEKYMGGWKLYNARPEQQPAHLPPNVIADGPKRYFVYTSELDYETVVRGRTSYTYAGTGDLWAALNKGTSPKQTMAVAFHQRLVRPLNGLILAVFGLAVILKDQNRHVFISAGLCLIVAVAFSAVVYGAKYMGDQEFLEPALAAWIPAVTFGPLAVFLFDAIHT